MTSVRIQAGLYDGAEEQDFIGPVAVFGMVDGQVVPGRVVDDGDLVTSGGVTSGLDLGLWLVERFLGPDAALQAETILEYERRGTVRTRAAR